MSDRPDDETLGRALGRAVESQSVRETPFSRSRLSTRLDHPPRGGWMGTLAVAAALGLLVAMGAFFVRVPFGVANPDSSGSPDPTPRPTLDLSAVATPRLSASPTEPAALVRTRVYFARDGLPPVGADVTLAIAVHSTPEQRIGLRVGALITGLPQSPSGARSVVDPRQIQSVDSVRVLSGDTALVDLIVSSGDWGVRGAAQTQALLQQLVYTATEDPGIRRVQITENGGKTPRIDQLVLDKPLTREDVFGYPRSAAQDRIDSGGSVVPSTLTAEVDYVQTGGPGQPVRLVIDLAPRAPVAGGSWLPDFVASMRQAAVTSTAKYELEVTIKGGTDTTTRDEVIDVTPLRYVATQRTSDAMTYRLGLDDARPWRVSIIPWLNGAMRLYVDVGGVTGTVNQNIAVYTPTVGQTVAGSINIGGAARVYEANVSWRLRDSGGREVARGFTTAMNGSGPVWGSFQTTVPVPSGLSGRATLEVFWASPRDGSDQDVVGIPLEVR